MNNYLPFKQTVQTLSSVSPYSPADSTTGIWHTGDNPCEMVATQYLHIPNKTIPATGNICGEIYWTKSQSYWVCDARDANGVCTKSSKKYLDQRYKAIVVCSLDTQGTQAEYDAKKGRTGNWTDTDWKSCPNGASVVVHFAAAPKATPASALAVFLLALTGGLLSQW